MACLRRLLALILPCLILIACAPPTRLVQQISPTRPAVPASTPTLIPPSVPPPATATPQGIWIQFIPSSGAPGDVIDIEGYLPGGVAQSELYSRGGVTYADLCWGGCQTGLMERGQQVTWSKEGPGRFHSQFTVPPAPWLAADGFHALSAGEYSVDLFNLDPTKYGCATPDPNGGCPVVPDASAPFTLAESVPGVECSLADCGSLAATPEKAAPGATVQVQGWAPLLGDLNMLSYYSVALVPAGQETVDINTQRFMLQQSPDGSLSGTFVVPQSTPLGEPLAPGRYNLYLSADGLVTEKGDTAPLIKHVPFEITPALAWAEVPHGSPLWIITSADLSNFAIAADSAAPDRMAYCAPGQIRLSENSGQSWQSIPAAAVAQVPLAEGVTVGEGPPICDSLVLDPAHPDSFFATFDVVGPYGAPPVYYAGYYTTNRGQTWQSVPLPSVLVDQQAVTGNFGGFWVDSGTVQALFYADASGAQPSAVPVVKQTTDGGLTWKTSTLTCPASGPCLRWGIAPAQVSGMGSDLPQSVVYSTNGGATWQDSGQTAELRYPAPHELVALSAGEALFLSGAEPFPLRYTHDGGATWQTLALPPLPGDTPQWPGGYLGLQMLPDGRLLAMQSATGQWYALAPGAADWCPVRQKVDDLNEVLVRQVGDRIWWLPLSTQEPVSVPESELQCER